MAQNDSRDQNCFHCGLPVPRDTHWFALVAGEPRPMCCRGCLAAAEAIEACGLSRFYQLRTADAPRPELDQPADDSRYATFDDPELQKQFVVGAPGGTLEADLILDGVTCAACCWLIEQRLGVLEGVERAGVNYTDRTARVRWDPARTRLSQVLGAIAGIGYHAAPYDAESSERQLARERGMQIRRIGIAGLLGMQVMMLSLALYLGADAGIDPGLAPLLQWSAGILVIPILAYAAQPFFRGAIRDLRARSLGMDVPVALGMTIAFLGSVHALFTGSGHIYFDSIAMFVFILLVGRFVEFSVRRQASSQWDRLQRIQPAVATRLRRAGMQQDVEAVVPVGSLAVGDVVLVRPGETVPADGIVDSGQSSLDESLLTGESRPLRHGPGDAVEGGSINVDSPLHVRVTRVSSESRLAQIARLAREAELDRPAPESLSRTVASRFIARLLVIAAAVAVFWMIREPERWVPITVSVLVITCPCALALAAPAALAAATGTLLRLGILVRRAHAVETLGRATLFVFDKTGTLTRGKPSLVALRVLGPAMEPADALGIAASLEAGSEHPVAGALRSAAAAGGVALPTVAGVRSRPGRGVEGELAGIRHAVGSPSFVGEVTGLPDPDTGREVVDGEFTRVLLGRAGQWLARFDLRDEPRPGAAELVSCLAGDGLESRILSGDTPPSVRALAGAVGIPAAEGALLPDQKVARLREWRHGDRVVCMIGDGVNDAPVLAAANVSVAMDSGADLARASADMVLLGGRLPALGTGIRTARRAIAIMRQNVFWAIGYNVVAVPLAATGHVTPWQAAIGMSLSSLLVVMNAARLARTPETEQGQ